VVSSWGIQQRVASVPVAAPSSMDATPETDAAPINAAAKVRKPRYGKWRPDASQN
jgi:hypothetical protein